MFNVEENRISKLIINANHRVHFTIQFDTNMILSYFVVNGRFNVMYCILNNLLNSKQNKWLN